MFFQLLTLALLGALATALFSKTLPELVLPVSLAAGGVMLWVILSEVSPALEQVQGWLEQTGAGEYTGVLLKSLGICWLAQLAADSCRDAGQTSAASKIVLGARAAILLLALPLFRTVLEVCLKLING